MKSITVVKFGGSLSRDSAARKRFLRELAVLSKNGPVVFVHGGGPEINSLLIRLGIESRFVNGLRYTDEAVLEAVEMVLSGKVNKGFVAELQKLGARPVGISGKDGNMVFCKRKKELGFVGEPEKVDLTLLNTLLKGGFLPVVSSLGFGVSGQTLNINADSLATALAIKLKAARLIFLTDVPGVLDGAKKTMPEIKTNSVLRLINEGVITGGMIPKIMGCAKSVEKGIKEVWIVDGKEGLKKLKGTVIK